MKLPRFENYRTMKLFQLADLRYRAKLNNRVMPIKGYDYFIHGVEPKTCFKSEEIQLLLGKNLTLPYHLGLEIEIEGINSSNKRQLGEILLKYLKSEHKVVSDASLNETGAEIVTIPLSRFDRLKFYRMLTEMRSIGLRAHDGGRCGLHISISRDASHKGLKISEGQSADRIAGQSREFWNSLTHFIEGNKEYFKILSRRERFGYCEFYQNGKYSAVNLSKINIVEFRFFRGTLKPSSFIASIDIIRGLIDYFRMLAEQGKYSAYLYRWGETSPSILGFEEFLRNSYPLAYNYIREKLEGRVIESDYIPQISTTRTVTRRPRRNREQIIADGIEYINDRSSGFYLSRRTVNGVNETVLNLHSWRSSEFIVDPSLESVTRISRNYLSPITLRHLREAGVNLDRVVCLGFKPADASRVLTVIRYGSGWGVRSSFYLGTSNLNN